MSPRALVIAGLDPSAGAGLVLDAFVFARAGYAPCTVATVVTAQNSAAFRRAVPVEPALVAEQIEAVCAEGPVACVKVGAVGSGENARLLAHLLEAIDAPVVLDPVLASSSGGGLVSDSELGALHALCSVVDVVTPNAEEAARLAGAAHDSPHDLDSAGRSGMALARRWRTAVVVTGVHSDTAPDAEAIDLLCAEDSVEMLPHHLVPDVGDVRGTGCMFSSNLAAGLGRDLPMRDAIVGAQREVTDLLASAAPLGRGRMQVDLGLLGG